MIGSVRIVSREGPALGFGLAGMSAHHAEDATSVGRHLDLLVRDHSVALVLVEDSLLSLLRPSTRRRLENLTTPLILPFSAPTWLQVSGDEAEAAILEILRQAVGYRIRLR